MAGARSWRKAPKMIADALLAHLPSIENSVFAKVEVAGPGFINLFLAPSLSLIHISRWIRSPLINIEKDRKT